MSSLYGIGGARGLPPLRPPAYLQNISAPRSQTVDTSQSAESVPQGAPAGAQAAPGSGQAQSTFSAMLGNMAADGRRLDGAGPSQAAGTQPPPPPPGADGGQSSSFGGSVLSLLQSVLYGDMTGAQSAAAAIQNALGGAASPSGTPTASSSSTPSSEVASPVASAPASAVTSPAPATDPSDPQSAFMSDLNGLLAAVQSGDQGASKTAAATLVFDMTALQGRLEPPPHWDGDAGSFRSKLASLLRPVQSGDMAGAQAAAVAIQNALNSAGPQLSGAAPAASPSASAPAASPSASTPSAPIAAATVPPAAMEQDGGQSAFMTDLKSLLTAVQSGDGAASQTAAAALLGDLRTQAEEFQAELARVAPPLPSFGNQGPGGGGVQAAYTQWSANGSAT